MITRLRLNWLVVLPVALLLALGGAAARAAEEARMPQRTISISASGSVTSVPDLAHITAGVVSDAETAAKALADNTAAMTRVLAALKGAGIEDRDLQTSDFSVQQRFEYSQDGKPPRLVGYTVSNQVHVRVRDLARLGVILDTIVSDGANQVSGVQFEVSKAEALKDQARAAAFANALRMAQAYAAAAGVRLGQVLSIAEGVVSEGPRPMMRNAEAAPMAAAVPIATGEQELQVQVSVVWTIE